MPSPQPVHREQWLCCTANTKVKTREALRRHRRPQIRWPGASLACRSTCTLCGYDGIHPRVATNNGIVTAPPDTSETIEG